MKAVLPVLALLSFIAAPLFADEPAAPLPALEVGKEYHVRGLVTDTDGKEVCQKDGWRQVKVLSFSERDQEDALVELQLFDEKKSLLWVRLATICDWQDLRRTPTEAK